MDKSAIERWMLILLVFALAAAAVQVVAWIVDPDSTPPAFGFALVTLAWVLFATARARRQDRLLASAELVVLVALGCLAWVIAGLSWLQPDWFYRVLNGGMAPLAAACGVASGFLYQRERRSTKAT